MKMHRVKLPGRRLTARDFDGQVAEFQVKVTVLNGFTALGIPVTEAEGCVCPGEGEPRPLTDLCNRAQLAPTHGPGQCNTQYDPSKVEFDCDSLDGGRR